MKKNIVLFVVLLFAFVSAKVVSAQNAFLRDRVDEMEIAEEVEELEMMGEAAMIAETRAESERLVRERRNFEAEVTRMQRRTQNLTRQNQSLQVDYNKKLKAAQAALKRADEAEARLKVQEDAHNRLTAQVNRVEQEAIQSLERRRAAEKRTAELRAYRSKLENRLKVANRIVEKNNERTRQYQSQAQRLSQRNQSLERQVAQAEDRAIQTYDKMMEARKQASR